ncbi:hypothetical protein Ancab_034364 [Ancistrocladus abbreviatus]
MKKNQPIHRIERKRDKGGRLGDICSSFSLFNSFSSSFSGFFFFFYFPCPASRICILTPADKHSNAAAHDVEASPLFFDQPSALPCECTSPVRRISYERRSGRSGAS